tara:strand:- start:57 stop:251 length:195 start_codon:yes stop_codon:yes gene_type:complete
MAKHIIEGNKYRVTQSIQTHMGTLYKDEVVVVTEILGGTVGEARVTDNMGRIFVVHVNNLGSIK